MLCGMNGANGKMKNCIHFFCVSSSVNNRNYVLEVDSKHILFDHTQKVGLKFDISNLKYLGRTLRPQT